jgi:hypothetical protein
MADALIFLRTRDGSVSGQTVVDAEDFAVLDAYEWRLHTYGYAIRSAPGRRQVRMHRAIMDAPKGVMVDHKDRDRLNNRRSNLRFATAAQNGQNVGVRTDSLTGARGVTQGRNGRWQARATLNGEFCHIGMFDSLELAATAASSWRAEHMPFSVLDEATV